MFMMVLPVRMADPLFATLRASHTRAAA